MIFNEYIKNSKKILRSYHNPLKLPENLGKKDRLEREFYDQEAQKYLDDFKESLFLYDPNEKLPLSHQYFYSRLQNVEGKHILDIGCGHGFTSVVLAKRGARVTSIDVSPKMIELTRRNASFNRVEDRVKTAVMSAQNLKFAENTFEHVVGLGILHHLNMDFAGREIYRVLKRGGSAIFIEPRIPFKFLIFVRSVFPNRCYESPAGSQLTDEEIGGFSRRFKRSRIHYFLFLRKLARVPILRKWEDALDSIDAALIRKYPWMKRLYWAFVVQVYK